VGLDEQADLVGAWRRRRGRYVALMAVLAAGGVLRFVASGGGASDGELVLWSSLATALLLWACLARKKRQWARVAPPGSVFAYYATLERSPTTHRNLGGPGVLFITDHAVVWTSPVRRGKVGNQLVVEFADIERVYVTRLRTYPRGVGLDINLRDGAALSVQTTHGDDLEAALRDCGVAVTDTRP
jgi:hypothetical protein